MIIKTYIKCIIGKNSSGCSCDQFIFTAMPNITKKDEEIEKEIQRRMFYLLVNLYEYYDSIISGKIEFPTKEYVIKKLTKWVNFKFINRNKSKIFEVDFELKDNKVKLLKVLEYSLNDFLNNKEGKESKIEWKIL